VLTLTLARVAMAPKCCIRACSIKVGCERTPRFCVGAVYCCAIRVKSTTILEGKLALPAHKKANRVKAGQKEENGA